MSSVLEMGAVRLGLEFTGGQTVMREILNISGAIAGLNMANKSMGTVALGMWQKQLDKVKELQTRVDMLKYSSASLRVRRELNQSTIARQAILDKGGTMTPQAEARYQKLSRVVAARDATVASTQMTASIAAQNVALVRMAAGYVAVGAAVTGAAVAMVKLQEHMENSLLTFAKTERSSEGMAASFRQSRQLAGRSSLSGKEAVGVQERLNERYDTSGFDTSKVGTSSTILKKVFKDSDISSTISDVAAGDFKRLEKVAGLSAEHISAILKKSGDSFDLSTAEGRIDAMYKALKATNGEALGIVEGQFTEQFKRMASNASAELGTIWASVQNKKGGTSAVLKDTAQMVELANKYATAISSGTSLVSTQLSQVVSLNHEWGNLTGRVHGYTNTLSELKNRLSTATVSGTPFGAQGERYSRLMSQGNDLAGGKDFSGAFNSYAQAAQLPIERGERARALEEQRTGRTLIDGKWQWNGQGVASGIPGDILRKQQKALYAQTEKDSGMKVTDYKSFEAANKKLQEKATAEAEKAKKGVVANEIDPAIAKINAELAVAIPELTVATKGLAKVLADFNGLDVKIRDAILDLRPELRDLLKQASSVVAGSQATAPTAPVAPEYDSSRIVSGQASHYKLAASLVAKGIRQRNDGINGFVAKQGDAVGADAQATSASLMQSSLPNSDKIKILRAEISAIGEGTKDSSKRVRDAVDATLAEPLRLILRELEKQTPSIKKSAEDVVKDA